MFTFQNMSNKRRREEDSDSDDGFGLHQQQLKKAKPWTDDPTHHAHAQHQPASHFSLHVSQTPPHIVSAIEAMTPVQSDHEETESPMLANVGAIRVLPPDDSDFDMDMGEDQGVISQPSSSPFASALSLRPAMLNASLFGSDSSNNIGRVPTPMHPTFRRSGMNGLGFPNSGSAGGLGLNSTAMAAPSMQAPMSLKGNRQETGEDMNRRMPSPISEDFDNPDTPTALTQSQLSRLSFAHDNPADQMEMDEEASPPTPRGRKRSGALTGPGRFSMGYRDDCEKCRQRVPGHISHFLPS